MKFKNPLIAVRDLAESIRFYRSVLGLRVVLDFGANVTLTGGVSLQTADTWRDFIGREARFGGCNAELYFEEKNFDAFVAKLASLSVDYVHPVKEHAWGQRVVRLYDPDRHIIEIGEPLEAVYRRFRDQGMDACAIAARMDVPLNVVLALQKKV